MVNLHKYTGKQLVSFLRQGDFAHAGEEEAIELLLSPFDKKPGQLILDVGCGLGGTADYIYKNGWGKVSAFDIESKSIAYAQQKYPDIIFHICDVVDCDQLFQNQFDIITLFNAFYAFPNQGLALQTLNKVTKLGGQMAIFDYADPCTGQVTPLFRAGDENTTPFIPIKLDSFDALLEKTGWQKIKQLDISDKYLEWYNQLLKKLVDNKAEILNKFGMPAFESALDTYTKIRDGIVENVLGGTIIYAQSTK